MKRRSLVALMAIMALACWVPAVSATLTQTFSLPSGATEPFSGLPVSATVTFIIDDDADTIEIQLSNTFANPRSIAQCLSDLGFVLTTGQTSGSLTSSSGLERTVAADKTYSDGSSVATGWGLQTNVTFDSYGTGLELDDLGYAGPKHLIIGPPNSSTNTYSNANASIAGNAPHNPLLFDTNLGYVDFLLSVPGIDDDTSVSFVRFSFGTTAGDNVDIIPVPPTALLLGSGLAGLFLLGRRRRR